MITRFLIPTRSWLGINSSMKLRMAMGATKEALLLTMISSNPTITTLILGMMMVLKAFFRLDLGLDMRQRYLAPCD